MTAARVVAVVPARMGSQRLPGKNRRLLGGRSLFDRAVDCALSASSIDEVLVTTDDPYLLAGDSRERVTLVPRPDDLAGAKVSTKDVVRNLFETYPLPDIVVLLQPTSPLRTPSDVDGCVDLLSSSPDSCPSVVSVCVVEHPIEWTFNENDGELDPVFGWDALAARSQDQPIRYRLNGAVYAVRGEAIAGGVGFVTTGSRMIEMSAMCSVDIDTGQDFEFARALLRANGSSGHTRPQE